MKMSQAFPKALVAKLAIGSIMCARSRATKLDDYFSTDIWKSSVMPENLKP